MSTLIMRQEDMSNLLARYPEVHELYAPVDYKIEDDNVTFIILHNGDKHDYALYLLFNEILPCKVVFTKDPFDPLFNGCKIIWRNGKWYL